MPKLKVPGATATFSQKPGALEFVLEHRNKFSIQELSRLTGVTYTSVAQALYSRSLRASRYRRTGAKISLALNMSEHEIAYLAGIVDGEGTLTIQARPNRSGKGQTYRPNITISNTSTHLRDWMNARGFYAIEAVNGNGRPYWRFQQSGFGLKHILLRLQPYLIVKKNHCDLILDFISQREAQSKHEPATDRMREIVEIFGWLNERMLELGEREDRMKSSTLLASITSSARAA
jgi:hypothetical protein